MTGFIRRNLAPSDRLGEILFGLIMALGFTGAVRIGMEEADNRTLFVSILGCNLAWGVVDGVMYVLVQLFERGRRFRVARAVQKAPSEAEALKLVEEEYGDQLNPVLGEAERAEVYRRIAAGVRGVEVPAARPTADDFLGGLAAGLVILLATAPLLVPFLVFRDPTIAVRVSHGLGLLLLFSLGLGWGRMVGARGWRIGLGLLAVGLSLVGICLLLGG